MITLYKDYSAERFDWAVSQAGLHAVIEKLPHKEHSLVGEGGALLSGGKCQRIAIARAYISNSDVILLDEAMASLDQETANQIEELLVGHSDLTCISVTHRYHKETLKKYDEVIVMEAGEIVESGHFDTLYQKKGHFYRLFSNA